MSIPKKALRKSQLLFRTEASAAVKDGSHQVCRVEFFEHGIKKEGFFKAISPTHKYPELLASISVAISHFLRSFQGESAAEERLVFDEGDRLIGTLSIALKGFKPLCCSKEEVFADPSDKELAIPSVKTLIEKDFISILIGRWFLDDDDAHPRNVGFSNGVAAHIDYDMFMYWFTKKGIKGERPVIGIPKKCIYLNEEDWVSFPMRPRHAMPYHWPTYDHPGELALATVPLPSTVFSSVLSKPYVDPGQFKLLAHRKEAQEQKLAASLRILITHQPEIMRARLLAVFGERPLNYKALGLELSAQYEAEFPLWCNETTNAKSFVDFIMTLYQEHYDSLYRLVVFYQGCEDNGYGVPLPATKNALCSKPSLYQNIVEWVKAQNSALYNTEEERPLGFKLDELGRRYHQIWRDSFAPDLKVLLQEAINLTNDIVQVAIAKDAALRTMIKSKGKEATDPGVTQSWHLFTVKPKLTQREIDACLGVDKDSPAYNALLQLVNFTEVLHDIAQKYYAIERSELNVDDNVEFMRAINSLYAEYMLAPSKASVTSKLELLGALGSVSAYAATFRKIAERLRDFGERIDFKKHLESTDEDIKKTALRDEGLKPLSPLHTDERIINEFKEALFTWANSATGLKDILVGIIDRYYAATLSLRTRSESVKAYLAASEGESGANRLAYILGTKTSGIFGPARGTGELNKLLIEHLAPRVLSSHPIRSISEAIHKGEFSKDIDTYYAEKIAEYARTNEKLLHLAHRNGPSLFYKTLFKWVNLDSSRFRRIVNTALENYDREFSSLRSVASFFGAAAPSRSDEVRGYFKESYGYPCSKILALIFVGGSDSSKLTNSIFQGIIDAIQAELKTKRDMLSDSGYRLIACYTAEERDAYFRVMNHHSLPYTHDVTAVTATVSTASAI